MRRYTGVIVRETDDLQTLPNTPLLALAGFDPTPEALESITYALADRVDFRTPRWTVEG